MKIGAFFFLIFLVIFTNGENECDILEKECSQTNYENYVSCMRSKRHISCPYRNDECEEGNDCVDNNCHDCNCQYCSSCEESCDSCCGSCCQQQFSCHNTHCCHKYCHSTCKSHSCRKTCRKSCYDTIKPSGGTSSNSSSTGSSSDNKHNITTVIHLNNLINNTNLIHIPVTLNNTNYHNITVENSGATGTGSGGGDNSNSNCCHVVGPRQCQPQPEFPFLKCFHARTKHCGNICSAPIVHSYPHEVCDRVPYKQPSCHQQIMYIPQPKPRCAYSQQWPYTQCGFQQNNCDGCYGGETYGCSAFCYDDGFGFGAFYRKGPFYRPGFSAFPSPNYPSVYPSLDFGGYGPGFLDPRMMENSYHIETDLIQPGNNSGIPAGYYPWYPYNFTAPRIMETTEVRSNPAQAEIVVRHQDKDEEMK